MIKWKVIALVSGNIEAVSGPAAQDRPGPTNGWSGKGKPLTKLKPSIVQRKPIPGLTSSGCAFAMRGILTSGSILLSLAVPRFTRNHATPNEPG